MRRSVKLLEDQVARNLEEDIRDEEDAQGYVVLIAAEVKVLVQPFDLCIAFNSMVRIRVSNKPRGRKN